MRASGPSPFPLAMVFVAAGVAAACGGEGNDDDDDDDVVADAAAPDATAEIDGSPGVCDPVAQQGCPAGQKCTALHPPAGSLDPVVTGCATVGAVAVGDACDAPEFDGGGVDTGRGDGTRTDDCAAGLYCGRQVGGDVCTPICAIGNDSSCPTDTAGEGVCVGYVNLFEQPVGICEPQCIPVSDGTAGPANATCVEGDGCYALDGDQLGKFLCIGVPTDAVALSFPEQCQPLNGDGECFINSAPAGAIPFVPLHYGGIGPAIVTPLCKPLNTHDASADPANDANGDEVVLGCNAANLGSGGQGQCRFIQSMFSDTGQFAADIGICVPTVDGNSWLDATTWDLAAFLADPESNPFCPGCVDAATLTGGSVAPDWEAFRTRLPKAPAAFREALEAPVRLRLR